MSECALLLNLGQNLKWVFMKLCQNDFLTLNKRLSRRAMLSDDSSCYYNARSPICNILLEGSSDLSLSKNRNLFELVFDFIKETGRFM